MEKINGKFNENTNVHYDCDTLFPIFGKYKYDKDSNIHLILSNNKCYPFINKESVKNIKKLD